VNSGTSRGKPAADRPAGRAQRRMPSARQTRLRLGPGGDSSAATGSGLARAL